MSDIFTRLEDLSAKLNATSDSISEALKQAEVKLSALRLGVEVWLKEPLRKDPLAAPDEKVYDFVSTYLGYAKIRGKWCIALSNDLGIVNSGNEEDNEEMPILQAPREDRISALKRIPELMIAIEKKAEEELHQIQSALASIAGLTAAKGNDISEAIAILQVGKDKPKPKPTVL